MLMDLGKDLQIFVETNDTICCKSDLGHNFFFDQASVESRYPNQSDINSMNYLGGKNKFEALNLSVFNIIPIE